MEAARRIEELTRELNDHIHRYHVLDAPIISDGEYDRLFQELVSLEEAYPGLAREDSPTRRVGAAPLDKFEQVEHRIPMLSLENGFSDQDLADFGERLERYLSQPVDSGFSVEPKMDGLAVELDVASEISDGDGESSARVRIHNPTEHLAFMVHLAVTKGADGLEVTPTFWEDNYFSLLPGETRTVTCAFASADLDGAPPVVRVEGWNVRARR